MGAVGREVPKALLPVGDTAVVGHHLRLLEELGAEDVFLVVGHLGAQLREFIGSGGRYGVRAHFIEQGAALGSAHALAQARGHVDLPFVLILGDYYFATSQARRLVERLDSGEAAITVQEETDAELIRQACEVRTDQSGRITGLVEKPTTPNSKTKGCGVYALFPDVFEHVARTPRTALRDEYELTDALDSYVRGPRPTYAEAIFDWDTNLTTPADVVRCNVAWLADKGITSYVAEGASVDPGVALANAVVGPGSLVSGTGSLSNAVVFPDTTIAVDGDLNSVVAMSGELIESSSP